MGKMEFSLSHSGEICIRSAVGEEMKLFLRRVSLAIRWKTEKPLAREASNITVRHTNNHKSDYRAMMALSVAAAGARCQISVLLGFSGGEYRLILGRAWTSKSGSFEMFVFGLGIDDLSTYCD